MLRTFTFGFAFALIAAAPHDDSSAMPSGFTPLYNGKDLSGWHYMDTFDPRVLAAMSEKDRTAHLAKWAKESEGHWKALPTEIVNDGHGAYLTTDKDYGDFELLIEYKTVPLADSGIYLRGCPQVQIWDPTKHPEGSGGLFNNKVHPSKPTVCADKPIGEWNTFRIKMVGEKVTVWLNGTLVVDQVVLENYWERDKPIYPTGQIELQNHGNTLYFKNIYLREL